MPHKESNQKKSFVGRVVQVMLYVLAAFAGCVIILAGMLLICSPGKPEPFTDEQGRPLPSGISEKIHVKIGGADQGMFIRGRDIKNPVLLFMHGGPGMPEYFIAEKYPCGLEDRFTVCYWDQRGGGISYSPDIKAESITVQNYVSDAVEVTNYLRRRFGQDKIYLMAHSWGTFIGIQAAAQEPELYRSYIGVAQISNMLESERLAYDYMLSRYSEDGNTEMVEKLEQYAVFESDAAVRSFFTSMLRDKTMHELGIGTMRSMKSVFFGVFLPVMQSKAYTPAEKINLWRAKAFLRDDTELIDRLFAADLALDVPKLEIPAYFMSGRYDYTVNHSLSKAYCESLQSPAKGFYTFEESAHSPMFEEPEKFMKIMTEDVLNNKTTLADAE